MSQIRETIIEAIRTRLATILTTNTDPVTSAAFRTGIGRKVEFGQSNDPTPTDVPKVNFWNGSEDIARQYGANARAMVITVEGYQLQQTGDFITAANKMLSDIENVLLYDSGVLTNLLGGNVIEITFLNSDPFLLTDVKIAGVVANFNIIYDTET